MRFVADDTLGALVRRLRILGFDVETLPFSQIPQKLSAEPDRVFLSRSRKRIKAVKNKSLWVQADLWPEQLRQVFQELALSLSAESFTRCSICNLTLEAVKDKTEIQVLVPDYIYSTNDEYYLCRACRRVYWPGSHWKKMENFIEELKKASKNSF